MRAILYARVSLEEQAEQFGLPSQLRAMRERVAASGYDAAEQIVDEGYSGSDLDRPGLGKIRDLVRAHAVDVVLVHDPDRLSRKLAHLVIIQEEFERAGVRLEFITTPSADTPEAKMLLSMKGVFAEFEREKIRERTQRGRKEKARQGFIVGGRIAFGYRYLGKKDGERGKLIVDDGQAAIVRQVFQWAAGGMSLRAIATKLNESGIQPRFATRWGKSSVTRLLKNETYIGQAHYNRHKRTQPKTPDAAHKLRHSKYTSLRERPESEWITIPTPAIIERSLFERVADNLHRNRQDFSGRPSRRYLLRGLVWCGKCGMRMHGDPNHGTPCYRCIGRDRLRFEGSRCSAHANAARLDTAVWKAVSEPFQERGRILAIIERHHAVLKRPDSKAKATQLQRRIDQLKARESRGVKALLDAGLTEHYGQVRRELAQSGDERRRLEREIRDLTQAGALQSQSVEAICREISDIIDRLTEDQKQEFLRRVVERIAVAGWDVEIHCVLPLVVTPSAQKWSQSEHVVGAGGRNL